MAFRGLSLLGVAAVLCAPAPADACSCARPGVDVSPAFNQEAPTNVRIHLALPPKYRAGRFGLVKRVTRRKETEVPVTSRAYGSADHQGVVLVPKAELDPDSDYEIVIKRGTRVTVLSTFVTGKGKDETAPVLDGIQKAGYFHPPKVCCNCTTGDPYVLLQLGQVSDDQTPEAALSFAVWAAAGGGEIDYGAPPVVIVKAWQGTLALGHPSTCTPANFDFPSGKSRLRLGVKAIDLAGNASEPSETILDLTNPSKRAPRR